MRRSNDPARLVEGVPAVRAADPVVDVDGSAQAPFAWATPEQVDVFFQRRSAKVDVLWVIDDSGSMRPKQEKIRQSFGAFMQRFVQSGSVTDFHIGVVTTDTSNPARAGRLVNRAGLSRPWIGPDTCARPGCDPVAAFRSNAEVGTGGAGDERGLLAATLALSSPLSDTDNAGFLRDDAALFVVVVSDEDDSSCGPGASEAGSGCAPPVQWGTEDYYVRFLEGLKGAGRGESVTVAAVVATAAQPLQGLSRPASGCRAVDDPAQYADYAPRYIRVAEKTGGFATSICDRDFSAGLDALGIAAAGSRRTFVLSRAPRGGDLRVWVTAPGEQRVLRQAGVDYVYRPCASGGTGVLNLVEFVGPSSQLPPPGSRVDIEYPVDVQGVRCP